MALSPNLTWIKGRHTWVFGGQLIETYDNYAQTNIASGAFAFNGSWTTEQSCCRRNGRYFLCRFSAGIWPEPSRACSTTISVRRRFRPWWRKRKPIEASYFGDTWRVTSKLTVNYGLRYDLPGPWSERHDWI